MKRSKFSEAQVAFILRQVDEGATVGEVCRKAGISEATFYVWRKKYAGLMPSEMKRLRQLEDENARLKRIVADLSLDKEMLQDVIKRPEGPRSTSSRTCPAPPARGSSASDLAGQHPARLRGAPGGTIKLSLQEQADRSRRLESADQGDRRDAGALYPSGVGRR